MNKFGESGQARGAVVIIVFLILIIGGLFLLPKFINFAGNLIKKTGNIAGITNTVPSPTSAFPPAANRPPGSGSPLPTVQPTLSPTPVVRENVIHGSVNVINNSDRRIDKVTLVYCGSANIPPAEQICRELQMNREAQLDKNSIWPDYISVNNHYYGYLLIEDAAGKPMQIGGVYLIAGAKAYSDGEVFISDEKWISLPFPYYFNFRIITP